MDPLPPPPPTNDDLRVLISTYHHIGDYFWWALTTGLLFLFSIVWRASGDRQNAFNQIRAHGVRIDEHAGRIVALEQGAALFAAKLGELPTRQELVAQTAAIDARFDRLDQRLDSVVSHPTKLA